MRATPTPSPPALDNPDPPRPRGGVRLCTSEEAWILSPDPTPAAAGAGPASRADRTRGKSDQLTREPRRPTGCQGGGPGDLCRSSMRARPGPHLPAPKLAHCKRLARRRHPRASMTRSGRAAGPLIGVASRAGSGRSRSGQPGERDFRRRGPGAVGALRSPGATSTRSDETSHSLRVSNPDHPGTSHVAVEADFEAQATRPNGNWTRSCSAEPSPSAASRTRCTSPAFTGNYITTIGPSSSYAGNDGRRIAGAQTPAIRRLRRRGRMPKPDRGALQQDPRTTWGRPASQLRPFACRRSRCSTSHIPPVGWLRGLESRPPGMLRLGGP